MQNKPKSTLRKHLNLGEPAEQGLLSRERAGTSQGDAISGVQEDIPGVGATHGRYRNAESLRE